MCLVFHCFCWSFSITIFLSTTRRSQIDGVSGFYPCDKVHAYSWCFSNLYGNCDIMCTTGTIKLRIEAPASISTNESDPRPVCGARHPSGTRLLSQHVNFVLFYSKINHCVPVPVFCLFSHSQCTKTLKQHPYVATVPVSYPGLYAGPGLYSGPGFYPKFYGITSNEN